MFARVIHASVGRRTLADGHTPRTDPRSDGTLRLAARAGTPAFPGDRGRESCAAGRLERPRLLDGVCGDALGVGIRVLDRPAVVDRGNARLPPRSSRGRGGVAQRDPGEPIRRRRGPRPPRRTRRTARRRRPGRRRAGRPREPPPAGGRYRGDGPRRGSPPWGRARRGGIDAIVRPSTRSDARDGGTPETGRRWARPPHRRGPGGRHIRPKRNR